MSKEIGKIIDNEATFLGLTFAVDIKSGDVNTSVDYDRRIIDESKQARLSEIIDGFIKQIVNECIVGE